MRIGINGRHLGQNKTGVGRYLINLLNVWAREVPQHEFFVYFSNERLAAEDEDLFKNFSHIVPRKIPRPMNLNSFFLWYNFSLPRAIKKDKIDFFFSPDYFLPPFLGKMKKSMTIHDVSFLAHPEWFSLSYQIYTDIYCKFAAKRSDIIFTMSEFSKMEIIKYVHLAPGKIEVIPLAVDKRFRRSPEMKEVQNADIEGKYFLYVGKIFNRRHVAEMLNAFDIYLNKSKDSKAQFVISGKNETHPFIDIDHMIGEINNRYKRKAIIHYQFIDDDVLLSLYRSATGFFYLSAYEGFGLPVLEALAMGTPTVTARYASLPEVAGDAAVYVNPTDISHISDIMLRLMHDSEWIKELRDKSILQASGFSWDVTARKTMEKIEQTYVA